jgi:regulator of protease activity HflC (stomatin/prohibitin superfamily)
MSGTLLMLRRPSRRALGWALRAVAAVVLIALFEPFTLVRAGSRGVLLNFGAVQPEAPVPGLHIVTPLVQSIVQLDTRIQKTQTTEDAASKDLQDVHTTVATNWSIDPEAAPQLYQTIGTIEQILDRLIAPAVANTIKAVTARFDAEELITKRDQVAEQTLAGLQRTLAPYHITVAAMNIINFAFSPDFSRAIEAKQVAQQRALQATYDLDQSASRHRSGWSRRPMRRWPRRAARRSRSYSRRRPRRTPIRRSPSRSVRRSCGGRASRSGMGSCRACLGQARRCRLWVWVCRSPWLCVSGLLSPHCAAR